MYITFPFAKQANKGEPTLALKSRGDITRNPKQGYQWPQNRTCERVRQKTYMRGETRSTTVYMCQFICQLMLPGY